MIARPVEDLGYGGTPEMRFGIVYAADWGGAESGWYIVVDRVVGCRTAWRIQVLREDSERMTQSRLDRLRELVEGENEKWRVTDPRARHMVTREQ